MEMGASIHNPLSQAMHLCNVETDKKPPEKKSLDDSSDQLNEPLGVRQVYKETFGKTHVNDEKQLSPLFFLSSHLQ